MNSFPNVSQKADPSLGKPIRSAKNRFARDDLKWKVDFFSVLLRKIGRGTGVLDKFLQGGHDGGGSEKFAKKIDRGAEVILGGRFYEHLGGRTPRRRAIVGAPTRQATGTAGMATKGAESRACRTGWTGWRNARRPAARSFAGTAAAVAYSSRKSPPAEKTDLRALATMQTEVSGASTANVATNFSSSVSMAVPISLAAWCSSVRSTILSRHYPRGGLPSQ